MCEVAGFVIAWRGHGSDQDLEQLVELWGRRDGDRDGSGDLGAHFVGEVVVGDADGVGLSGLTDGGVDDRASQDAREGAVVVAGSENGLANDQVVWQFHPDDDVGAVGFDVVLHEEGRWNVAADPFMDRPRFPAGELRSRCVSSRCHAAPRLPDSVGGIVSRGAAGGCPGRC